MYKAFYGFKENPFALTPDPSFLYRSKQHQMALSLLTYGLQSQAGITVISGEVGSGKTILIREILRRLEDKQVVGMISNTHSAFGDLLQWVLRAFNISSEAKEKADRYQVLVDFLINNYAENKKTILIIDEAQNMNVEMLEELRLISNINADKHMVLQLVLVGQPELLTMLQRHDLRQMAQRVSVDYTLRPLSYKETVLYIRHRLVAAGGSDTLFDKYAIGTVYYHSGGTPRLVNMLCDFALVFGFSEALPQINLDIMFDVVKGKQQGGIFPIPKNENKQQAIIKELIKQEQGIDISLVKQEKDDLFVEL